MTGYLKAGNNNTVTACSFFTCQSKVQWYPMQFSNTRFQDRVQARNKASIQPRLLMNLCLSRQKLVEVLDAHPAHRPRQTSMPHCARNSPILPARAHNPPLWPRPRRQTQARASTTSLDLHIDLASPYVSQDVCNGAIVVTPYGGVRIFPGIENAC